MPQLSRWPSSSPYFLAQFKPVINTGRQQLLNAGHVVGPRFARRNCMCRAALRALGRHGNHHVAPNITTTVGTIREPGGWGRAWAGEAGKWLRRPPWPELPESPPDGDCLHRHTGEDHRGATTRRKSRRCAAGADLRARPGHPAAHRATLLVGSSPQSILTSRPPGGPIPAGGRLGLG